MTFKETKRDGKQLICAKCKFKVEWEATPFAEKEKASEEANP